MSEVDIHLGDRLRSIERGYRRVLGPGSSTFRGLYLEDDDQSRSALIYVPLKGGLNLENQNERYDYEVSPFFSNLPHIVLESGIIVPRDLGQLAGLEGTLVSEDSFDADTIVVYY